MSRVLNFPHGKCWEQKYESDMLKYICILHQQRCEIKKINHNNN